MTKQNMRENSMTIDVLFPGFPGRLANGGLGWGTVALIRHPAGNVLVDTGGPAVRPKLEGMLKERGLEFGDIGTVFLTHLHWDHAYNVEFFPKAEFVVGGEEWRCVSRRNHGNIHMDRFAPSYLRRKSLRLVEEDGEEILPGLTTLLLPGHTPGSMGMVAETAKGKAVLVGDACKNRMELRLGEVTLCTDAARALESLHKIQRAGRRILPGHDGWLKILRDGSVVPETETGVKMVFDQGLTVNGGNAEFAVRLDD